MQEQTLPSFATEMQLSKQLSSEAESTMAAVAGEAKLLGHDYIGTEHLLLALIKHCKGVASIILANLTNLPREDLYDQIKEKIPYKQIETSQDNLIVTPKVRTVLQAADRIASEKGNNYIGSAHVLLALAEDLNGLAAQLLEDVGVTCEKLNKENKELLDETS